MDAALEKTSGKRISHEMQNFIGVYSENREQQRQAYPGYNFTIKSQGTRYRNGDEVGRFCADKSKEGKRYREIAQMLGLKDHSTVAYYIKTYNQRKFK